MNDVCPFCASKKQRSLPVYMCGTWSEPNDNGKVNIGTRCREMTLRNKLARYRGLLNRFVNEAVPMTPHENMEIPRELWLSVLEELGE